MWIIELNKIMTVNSAGKVASAHSSSIGVIPNMPGQSLLPRMPHHELLEWVHATVPAGVNDILCSELYITTCVR